jgi:uncharacterized repeat protein (TIGR03803 family)
MNTSTTGLRPAETRAFRRELLIVVLVGWAAAVTATAQTYELVHAFRASGQTSAGGQTQSGLILADDGYFYGTTFADGKNGVGTVFRIDSAGHLTTIHSFAFADGANPLAGVIQANDGNLYGTTSAGGANNLGTVFKVDLSGDVTRIYSFKASDGLNPGARLLQASDGNFYGTTLSGGAHSAGTVFRVDSSGTFTTLHSFDRDLDGINPGELIQADGHLYGTTAGDQAYPPHAGTIFRADLEGEVETIHQFFGADGQNPRAPLMQASDGNFYGTAYAGGGYGLGLVFQLTPSGVYTPLHHFNHSDGALPSGGLIEGSSGYLYGTTVGTNENHEYGTVFRITASGELVTLHAFSSSGGNPRSALVFGADGALYGTTNRMRLLYPDPEGVVPGTVFRLKAAGQFDTLHTFQWEDGAGPALIQGADGAFYGTTAAGGTSNLGTAFRLTSDGQYQALHDFNGSDGSYPTALIQADDGNLYGATAAGGAADFGTIFRMTADGELTTLHVLQGTEGAHPSQLMQASDGKLYGVATYGGPTEWGAGTIFRIDSAGAFQMIGAFSPFTDGLHPNGPLIESGSWLCGTTQDGGAYGYGIVFCSSFDGGIYSDYSFNFQTDGAWPLAGLSNFDGEIFGTTSNGAEYWAGTVFKTIAASYDLDTWHVFNGNDGGSPAAQLTLGSVGGQYSGIYGTTGRWGPRGAGTIFRLGFDRSLETVHGFGGIDGGYPYAALIQGSDGLLYGTAGGGPFGAGVVFRLTLSSIAVNEVSPPSGPSSAGAALDLLGGGFTANATVTIGGLVGTDLTVLDPAFSYLLTPALSPGTLNDVSVTIPTTAGTATATKVGAFFADFLDVPQLDPFHDYVEKIFRKAITAGCAPGKYCPRDAVTRAQMAVFLLKSKHGSSFVPQPCTGVFGDVPCPSMFGDWIEQLAAEGITAGCGGGNYCPSTPVTRSQMAVFLLKAKYESSYLPPACAGVFGDVVCPSVFADWIEQLAAEQITGGCGGGNYCPDSPSTRAQMSAFLVKAFHM